MTNRERLAQMTNEELAEFICKQHVMCFNCVGRDMCCTNGNGALAWLESEAEAIPAGIHPGRCKREKISFRGSK